VLPRTLPCPRPPLTLHLTSLPTLCEQQQQQKQQIETANAKAGKKKAQDNERERERKTTRHSSKLALLPTGAHNTCNYYTYVRATNGDIGAAGQARPDETKTRAQAQSSSSSSSREDE